MVLSGYSVHQVELVVGAHARQVGNAIGEPEKALMAPMSQISALLRIRQQIRKLGNGKATDRLAGHSIFFGNGSIVVI